MKITGEQIKIRREELGLTIAQLSKLLNVSRQAIYNWESSTKTPQNRLLPLISEVLNIETDIDIKPSINHLMKVKEREERKTKNDDCIVLLNKIKLLSNEDYKLIESLIDRMSK
ncbi:MAG: helix-turn-helix transcriptional regulator [Paraclostridium sp.]